MSVPYIINENTVTVFVEGDSFSFDKDHCNYDKIIKEIEADETNIENLIKLVDMRRAVENFVEGNIQIEDGELFYKGILVDNFVSNKIFDMIEEEVNVTPLIRFLDKLMSNPSKWAIDELYGFLDYGKLPITPDGDFIAFKKVRYDYKDIHTGSIDNSVGKVVTMLRGMVDDDKNKTCSSGLHFCSKEYLSSFGSNRKEPEKEDRIVILQINPRDVVSIPTDYNNTKGRCCKYTIVGDIKDKKVEEVSKEVIFRNTGVSSE